MAYLVEQISNLVNDAVSDALAKNGTGTIKQLDTSDFASLGKALEDYDLLDGWFSALTRRIAKTVYFVRAYQGRSRSVLRDEQEYGAFVQKVYYSMPDAVDNSTWSIPDGTGQYKQNSPYDVETTISVNAMIFGGKGTWAIEIVRPLVQIKDAFRSASEMAAFIDGIYVTIENSYKLEEERVVASAVNTAMASALTGNGKHRNLLSEYNTAHPTATLTVAECLESADFLKYASKEIALTIENMRDMSTAFNKLGYETFTTEDKLVVEMLGQFAKASDVYLQADTFHNDMVKLPNFERVNFWQTAGNYSFSDVSKISIKNDGVNSGTAVVQGGIICFLHDIENVAAYFGARRSWEIVNPRDEVLIHGEKAEKGFAIDDHANAVVFYIAE